jgi:type I restriction enzyme S subunit
MNDTLEAMARAIFKDWFVDFGPTRAKMEGRAPYRTLGIWSLFPDRLDYEGKPEGWETVELGSVVSELRRGISPTYIQDGGVRVLNQKCIRNRQVDTSASRRHDRNKRAVEGRGVNIGDILINSTGVGTLGRTAQIWEIDEPTIVDSHVTVVRPNTDRVSSCYIGLNLTGREHEIEALGEGSTGQTELSRIRVAALLVLLPRLRLQKEFEQCGRPLVDRMTLNWCENRTLAATRDLLLPKLMSGEIHVKDADRTVGDVL